MNDNFVFYLNHTNSLRELYLMLRTFPRIYEFKCKCSTDNVHKISALNIYAECQKCGYDDKLYHKADGDEIHDVIFLVMKWLGIEDENQLNLGLHPDDVEKEIDWSKLDKRFKVTPEEIEAVRAENIYPSVE